MRANTLVIFVLHLTSTKKATSGKFAPKPHAVENVVKDPTQTAAPGHKHVNTSVEYASCQCLEGTKKTRKVSSSQQISLSEQNNTERISME